MRTLARIVSLSGRGSILLTIVAAAAFTTISDAAASTIVLSSHSDSPTLDPGLLDATLDFQVAGSTQLTLTFTNSTAAPNEFKVDAIYFNATLGVTGLTLDSGPRNWSLETAAGGGTTAGVFGTFDFVLVAAKTGRDGIQAADGSVDFVFTIAGAGPFTGSDFTTQLSQALDSDMASNAAASFAQGPLGASGYGAYHTPEPSTALLLAAGLVALALRRRRA
jgi:hypothetical protein